MALYEDTNKLVFGLLIATVFVVVFNFYQVMQLQNALATGNAMASNNRNSAGASNGAYATLSGIVPSGVPEIYGAELQISFDDVSAEDQNKADATIRKLAQFDQTINLTGADKERYIDILYRMENGISCEYCCGAKAIIFENGGPACGCAHSYAMRGLAKYLITEHGAEYTDTQILEELGKWKTLFFPTQIEQKAAILQEQGIELSYINLASNKYRGIEKGTSAGGGMVGGC